MTSSLSSQTLLDVLAGRKKSGKIEGRITLNGHDIDPITFSRISGYVEQLDVSGQPPRSSHPAPPSQVHHPGPTVRESIDFSASLRLDPVHADKKTGFCDQLLDLLELTPIADQQVGDIGAGGLSFEQRKRLTMAVRADRVLPTARTPVVGRTRR